MRYALFVLIAIVAGCALIALVLLSYPLGGDRVRFGTAWSAGALLGAAALVWLRTPETLRGGLPIVVPAAFVLFGLAGLAALLPAYRRSPAFRAMRPVVWGLALVLVGVIAGLSLEVQDFEITRARSHAVGKALERYRLENGAYPARLSDLVPRYLDEVPAPRAGWSSGPFHYESTGHSYLLSYVSARGRWDYDSRRAQWENRFEDR